MGKLFEEGNITILAPEDTYPEVVYEQIETAEILKSAIDELRESQKNVIVLYYYKNYSFADIAVKLNISQSRVSQIHKQAIACLKRKLLAWGIMNTKEGCCDN